MIALSHRTRPPPQMRRATMTPSAWLRLLCPDWSLENEAVVAAVDANFLRWKSYLRGQLTSQLLCRVSIGNGIRETHHDPAAPATIDFWQRLGVHDGFDRAHIVANIERFCSLYNICGGAVDEPAPGRGPAPAAAPAPHEHAGPRLYDALAHPVPAAVAPMAQVLYPTDSAAGVYPTAVADALPPQHSSTAGGAHPTDSAAAYPITMANALPQNPPTAGGAHPAAARVRYPSIKSQERRLKAEMKERERQVGMSTRGDLLTRDDARGDQPPHGS